MLYFRRKLSPSLGAFLKKAAPFLLIFLAQQLIYLRLSFTPLSHDYRLGGDFLSFHYLINLFNSDAYRAGTIPLWNPYIHSGFPWVIGLEYKVFYPVQILISFLVGYSYEVMQAEFVLTILFGGIGLFKLLQAFGISRVAACFGAISFLASGIFVGNSQHFGQLIVYAFTPWIFLVLYRIFQTNQSKYAIYGAFLLSLTVTGGYTGTYIVLAYLIAVFGLTMIVLSGKRLRMAANLSGMGILASGLGAVYLLPCYFGFSHLSRSTGLPYEDAVIHHSLSPLNLFTLVLPRSATNPLFQSEILSDMSMWNFHVGTLVPCLMAVALLVSARNRQLLWLIFFLSILMLLAAMGDFTPVRPLMYEYLPAMEKLRLNSAIFRGFTILGFCFIASFGLHHILENKTTWKEVLPFAMLPALLIGFITFSDVSQAQREILIADLPMVVAVLAIFLIALACLKRHKLGMNLFAAVFLILIVCELSIAVRANSISLWARDPGFRRGVEQLERSRDRKFANLAHARRIHQFGKEENFQPLLQRNPSNYGPSSSMLIAYERFMATAAAPLTVVSQTVLFPEMVSVYSTEEEVGRHLNAMGVLSAKHPALLSSGIGSGTLRFAGPASLGEVTAPTINSFEFTYSSGTDRLALWNQAYYPGWKAVLKETGAVIPISKANMAFSGLHLPAGSGTVHLEFSPKPYQIGKWITFSSLVLAAIFLCGHHIRSRKRHSPDGTDQGPSKGPGRFSANSP